MFPFKTFFLIYSFLFLELNIGPVVHNSQIINSPLGVRLNKVKVLSHSVVSSSLQTHVAHQAVLSMGFPRQEYWSG